MRVKREEGREDKARRGKGERGRWLVRLRRED